jgi:hypothetical protein
VALAITSTIFTTPLTLIMSILSIVISPLEPYVSWAHMHANFPIVRQIPSMVWRNIPGFAGNVTRASLGITRWATVGGGVLFFLLYGLAPSSVAYYKTIWRYATWPIHRGKRSSMVRTESTKRKGVVDTTCMFHEGCQSRTTSQLDCGCHSLTATSRTYKSVESFV